MYRSPFEEPSNRTVCNSTANAEHSTNLKLDTSVGALKVTFYIITALYVSHLGRHITAATSNIRTFCQSECSTLMLSLLVRSTSAQN